MTGYRDDLTDELKDREFRREYVAEHVRTGLAHQIRAMREAQEPNAWTQAELAQRLGTSQSNVARLEDPDYGKFTLSTLLSLADAFDVWLSVEFVPFSEGLRRTEDRSPAALAAPAFEQELASESLVRRQAVRSSAPIVVETLFVESKHRESPHSPREPITLEAAPVREAPRSLRILTMSLFEDDCDEHSIIPEATLRGAWEQPRHSARSQRIAEFTNEH